MLGGVCADASGDSGVTAGGAAQRAVELCLCVGLVGISGAWRGRVRAGDDDCSLADVHCVIGDANHFAAAPCGGASDARPWPSGESQAREEDFAVRFAAWRRFVV